MSSASELEYHLLLVCDVGLLKGPDCGQLTREVTEVKRVLALCIHEPKTDR